MLGNLHLSWPQLSSRGGSMSSIIASIVACRASDMTRCFRFLHVHCNAKIPSIPSWRSSAARHLASRSTTAFVQAAQAAHRTVVRVSTLLVSKHPSLDGRLCPQEIQISQLAMPRIPNRKRKTRSDRRLCSPANLSGPTCSAGIGTE